jgi:DNA phosphorothioation-dependent restriction protein DptH
MMVLSIQAEEATLALLVESIRELDKHYSLYVNGDKKITKIKGKAFWELIK